MEFFIIIAIFFIFACSSALLNNPKTKGKHGELKVATLLNKLPRDEYIIINNILLEIDGYTSQIDHIIISIYGIFVIETKNYSGWITGSENSIKWTKSTYGNKYKFYNPIKQNKGHITYLKKILKLSSDKFISIIVFSNNAKLKINSETSVVYMNNLLKEIKLYNEQKFSYNEIDNICDHINIFDISSEVNYKEYEKDHIKNIQNRIKEREEKIKNLICPYCGNQLIKRKGKYGKFLGCSGYPKCKFTD